MDSEKNEIKADTGSENRVNSEAEKIKDEINFDKEHNDIVYRKHAVNHIAFHPVFVS